ncbi:MAG TPA: lytic transglycosylase domain-containing protein [Campylobacterales bacterium]|nr:lytic transglycosylase domain-containing protein [Campylobacterales bacterium]
MVPYYRRLALLLSLFVALCHTLEAKPYTLQEIEVMPQSIARDFYIWRFLEQPETTEQQALTAYELSQRKNAKLKKAIRKKIGYTPKTPKPNATPKDPKNFIIYPYTAANKSRAALRKLYRRIQQRGQYSDVLQVMTSNDPFETLGTLTAQTQCYIFNNAGTAYRKKRLNHPFPPQQLDALAHEEQFNLAIFKIVTTPALDRMKRSLLGTPVTSKLEFQSRFLLAINAIEFNALTEAQHYLQHALSHAQYQSQKDQCNFWLYLVTEEKVYLQRLIQSNQVNLYTLRARDLLNRPYPKVITPKLSVNLVANIDPHYPIDWERIKIKMQANTSKANEKLAERYNSYMTEGIYCYLKEKASNYTQPYYPMPYPDAMLGRERERIALLYAIARQESRFVPASISTSYALGMMQIMPFLIKHLAQERGETLELEQMFDPYVAIDYADQHLNYLTKHLYHPLFIAYAYNGGIGFTKRTIKKENLFKQGRFEPYLSMELIDYPESRDYGKKVLTNYVIYSNLLGAQLKITDFLNMLDKPSLTDRFRKE